MRRPITPRKTRRFRLAVLTAALALVALGVAFPASASLRTFRVRLANGTYVTVSLDALPCLLNGLPVQVPCGGSSAPAPSSAPSSGSSGGGGGGGGGTQSAGHSGGRPSASGGGGGQGGSGGGSPSGGHGSSQPRSSSGSSSSPSSSGSGHGSGGSNNSQPKGQPQGSPPVAKTPTSAPSTPPSAGNGFFNSLPGPNSLTPVPNFVIQNFSVPFFLLPIYQAAGIQYDIPWQVLAGINEIETDYGRNLSTSSAGAEGWMQFIPSTWAQWGVDATDSGKRDPYNPVDAIFAAARYLKAAGGGQHIRNAIFAYNHAGWYVDSVMLRGQLLASYPKPFINSLIGLTRGVFPVLGQAHYGQGDIVKEAQQHAKLSGNATTVETSGPTQSSINIYAREGAPVVAASDGVVVGVGNSHSDGNYVVIQDAFGNRYTYTQLGDIQHMFAAPRDNINPANVQVSTNSQQQSDTRPTQPASAGAEQQSASPPPPPGTWRVAPHSAAAQQSGSTQEPASPPQPNQASSREPASPPQPQQAPVYKARLFAHPSRPDNGAAGGQAQLLAEQGGGQSQFDNGYSLDLNAGNSVLEPLRRGAVIVAGTVIGHVGRTTQTVNQPPHLAFAVQPAGKDAPKIDPQPILDGWRLLQQTHIYRPSNKDVLYRKNDKLTIGQALLFTKSQLEQRILSDPRIRIYSCGRNDIKTHQIDVRVLGALEYLADNGLYPTVSALKCGHSSYTQYGVVSPHATGDAVNISAINNVQIQGHEQKSGSITATTIKQLMRLQGTMQPDQIISQISFGQNTVAQQNENNHIDVSFQPLFGENSKLGQETKSILTPTQWNKFIAHVASLSNPIVPASASGAAIPDASGQGGG